MPAFLHLGQFPSIMAVSLPFITIIQLIKYYLRSTSLNRIKLYKHPVLILIMSVASINNDYLNDVLRHFAKFH